MSILNDAISDALRPLPNAPVVRRLTAEDAGGWDDFSPETPETPNTGALTVYRLQMDGAAASPPLAPPIPRPTYASTPSERSLPTAAVFQHDALLPLVNRVNGLEAGQESPSVRLSDAKERFEKNSVANNVSQSNGLESIALDGLSNLNSNVDGNSSSSIYRDGGNDERRRETGKAAPSGELFETRQASEMLEPGGADAAPQQASIERFEAESRPRKPSGERFDPPFGAQSEQRANEAVSRDAAREPYPNAAAEFDGEPPQAKHAQTPSLAFHSERSAVASRAEDTSPKLSIGRIEVTVLAQAPAAKPSQESADSAFLSKHYLRRI